MYSSSKPTTSRIQQPVHCFPVSILVDMPGTPRVQRSTQQSGLELIPGRVIRFQIYLHDCDYRNMFYLSEWAAVNEKAALINNT